MIHNERESKQKLDELKEKKRKLIRNNQKDLKIDKDEE